MAAMWVKQCLHRQEYNKFRVIQDREFLSDFDKQLKLLFGDKKD